MKKRILSFLMFIILTASLFLPVSVQASSVPDTSRKCSLTISYTQEGTAFADVDISVYRVADYFPSGIYGLVPPFSNYPVNIHGITTQTEWDNVASTLYGYTVSDKIAPTASVRTDEDGIALFENLQTGLYLIPGVTVSTGTESWQYQHLLVFLPSSVDDETFGYDLEIRPKNATPVENRELTVRKLWIDAGYTDQRPASVTIDIFKNGTLHETKVLNAGNNWSYSWTAAGGTDIWTMVEKDVPETYEVTVSISGGILTLTNTYIPPIDPDDTTEPTDPTSPSGSTEPTSPSGSTEPTGSTGSDSDPTESTEKPFRPGKPSYNKPPKTGDTFPLIPYSMAMCISGFLLLILGIWRRRFTR